LLRKSQLLTTNQEEIWMNERLTKKKEIGVLLNRKED